MRANLRGSLLRLGLAAALACGMMPAAAFAQPEQRTEQTPPR